MSVAERHNARMHVCHIITRLIVGGAQENTLLSCEGLHARGYQVTLISGPTTGPEGSLAPRARDSDYRFIELPSLVRPIRPWTDWRARREIAALLSELRPDVVHTHSSKAGVVGRWAALDADVPHIVHTIHGMAFNRAQPWWLRRLGVAVERRANRATDCVVTVADAMIAQSVAAGACPREKMRTIYSGIETGRFDRDRHARSAVRSGWGVGEDDVVVATIARLFRNKGYEQLLPIMADAARRAPQLRFVWIGDGAYRSRYERELTRLGLRSRTTLTGLVSPEEVPRLLAGADVLAHPSRWEGLPRAVVQGLLMQLPAVSFDIDGAPEVVRDGETGRLIPLDERAAFADALVELAHDPDKRRRWGVSGRALCLDRFDCRRMVADLDELYRRLVAGGRRR